MKTLFGTLLAVSIFTGVALAFESQYKTRLITSATLTIHVKDGQYIVIRNFIQDRAASQRGVIVAGVIPSTPTPTATPTPTPTPNPTPTPTTTDLTATKTNNVNSQVTLPNTWTWKIHVANSGGTPATFGIFQTILTDNLPNSSVSYDQLSVTGTNSSQISCDITNSDLNCVASNTITFNPGDSFDVSFRASPLVGGSYGNPRAGGGCSVDPGNVVPEANENNNTCANTVIANSPNPTPTPIFAPVLTAAITSLSPADRNEFIKPIIVAGPATLTIDPVPPATLAITYRKGLQPIQPTPTPTSSVTSAFSSTSSSFSTSKSASTSTTTRSTTVTLSDDDEIEWSTPSPTQTPTPTPTPTASPRLRAATTPTPTATPSLTPTATPQK
jgi:hypothetical protein